MEKTNQMIVEALASRRVSVRFETLGFRFLDRLWPGRSELTEEDKTFMRHVSRSRGATAAEVLDCLRIREVEYDEVISCMALPDPAKDSSHLGLSWRMQHRLAERCQDFIVMHMSSIKKVLLDAALEHSSAGLAATDIIDVFVLFWCLGEERSCGIPSWFRFVVSLSFSVLHLTRTSLDSH